MNPRDFLHLAEELSKKGSRPAALRSAVSRAYYAVFHVGAEVLGDLGFSIDKGSRGHGQVPRYLLSSGDAQIVGLGSDLSELHSKRIPADYRLNRQDIENPAEVRSLVILAQGMIQLLDQCGTEPRRSQIKNAIQTWIQKTPGNRP